MPLLMAYMMVHVTTLCDIPFVSYEHFVSAFNIFPMFTVQIDYFAIAAL